MAEIILKTGREKSLLRHHPWIFSGALANVHGSPKPGETVDVISSRGEFLAKAAYNPVSQIIGRVWNWSETEEINPKFFERLLSQSIAARNQVFRDIDADGGIRLVYAESDSLPGLIVDRYADTLVVQFLSMGAEYWREEILDILLKITGKTTIYERSDVDVRRLEGLPERTGIVRGAEPPDRILIEENGLRFSVDVRTGHKTGFYLDQRKNRLRIRELASNKDILDCFCYTGGFSINAIKGNAKSVLGIDSSADALEKARENLNLKVLEGKEKATWQEGDVFHVLRELRDRDMKFDLVIMDPPKFAPTVSQVEKAARGYKDINLLAFKLLRPGGTLVTFSCSGGISEDLFQKIVAGAALDASVTAQIVERLSQDSDHPIALNFPEGAYLKGLVLRSYPL